MADKLIFYTHPRSRGAIVRWMLEELGEPYETLPLNLGPEMKSKEYLAINPMGKVPTVIHGDQVITELGAICAYLADAFPERGLTPDKENRGAYLRWLFFATGPVEAAITDRFLGVKLKKKNYGQVGYGNYDLCIDTLAKAVSNGYVAGDRFTAADVVVGSHVGWGLAFKTLPERTELRAYHKLLEKRPARLEASRKDSELAREMGLD